MSLIKIRTNGIRPDSVVAEWEAKTAGGAGERKAVLGGWSTNELGARQRLFDQAKALRDELNLAIEDMIGEIIDANKRS